MPTSVERREIQMPKVKHTSKEGSGMAGKGKKRKKRAGTGDKSVNKSVRGGGLKKETKRRVGMPVEDALRSRKEQNSERRLSSSSSDASLKGVRPAMRELKKKKGSTRGELEDSHSSSGESTAGGRKRKRGASSESGEDERRGRKGAKEVKVSQTSQAKWKPVSQVARKLLSDGMLSALGHSLDGLKGSHHTAAENTIQQVMKRVEQEVAAAKAPLGKRVKSCGDLKMRLAELKEKCLGLVDRNQEIAQRLEERKLFCQERRLNVQQLEAAVQSHTQCYATQLPEPPPFDPEDDTFADYIKDLMLQPPTLRLSELWSHHT